MKKGRKKETQKTTFAEAQNWDRGGWRPGTVAGQRDNHNTAQRTRGLGLGDIGNLPDFLSSNKY